jgi:uncharacterized protein (DUF1778 family)
MTRKKSRTKTAVLTLRVSPELKAAAEVAADLDHRSLTSLIEVLIMKHCQGLHISTNAASAKASSR